MADEKVDPSRDAAAKQFVILDLLKDLLAYSENPGEMGSYITRQVRELLGARIVVLVHYQDAQGQKIVSIQPQRFRKWDRMAALQGLLSACRNLTSTRLFHAEDPPSEIIRSLNELGVRAAIVSPLMVGNELVGCLYAIDLLELIREADTAETLATLSPVVALVLRNATFFDSLESIIQERTQELRRSEDRFLQVVDCADEWIWEVDAEGLYTYASGAVQRLLGYTPEELVGRFHFHDLFAPEVRDSLRAQAQAGFDQKVPFRDFPNLNMHKDGRLVFLETSGVPILDPMGNLLGYRGADKDVTDRRRAELEVERLTMLLKESQAIAKVGGWEVDLAAQTLHWTDETFRIHETTPEAYAPSLDTALSFYAPESATSIQEALRKAIAEGSGYELDLELVTAKGRRIWVQTTCHTVLVQGRVVKLVGFIQDVTRRKKAEEALRESEARFVSIAENSPAVFYRYSDRKGGVYYSPRTLDLLGYAPEALLADPLLWRNAIHPDDRPTVDAAIAATLSGRGNLDLVYRIRNAAGQERWFRDCASAHPTRDGERILDGVVMDITEPHLAADEKTRLEAQLQEAHKMESLGILSAGVAHNLNNILSIIMGNASLREEAAADPLDREAYLGITKACERGREVVKSMLHFAQPALSSKAPVDLHAIIREVRVLLENTARNAVRISEAFAGEPLWIDGDAGSINHAILNLCLNAMGALPTGGSITLRTAVLAENRVEVSVEDDGTGMTPEVLAHVLEPFYTTKEVGRGTGLGLSMTYGVVKAHGGTIDIVSQPGKGTAVRLRFPRIPAPVQVEAARRRVPAPGSMKVFLVDDDEDVRFLMARMLKQAGTLQVKTFSGGEQVLESLRSGEHPDLVILDQNMPGMNGTQTLERIRSLHPEMPVLISSGQPDIEAWSEFKRPRVGVISKPFSMEEIQAKLAQFARFPGAVGSPES